MAKEHCGPAIEIRGLTKWYGKVPALNDLTFDVPRGVIAGFVGPNGAGKTTTIRILATLLRQDRGSARIFGYDTRSPSALQRIRTLIGYMPDHFGLYTDMTAGAYLDFFAAAYEIRAHERPALVDALLSRVGLADRNGTLIASLSRGLQQKLSIGRALIHSPRLLLLDEPASGLDPRARIELMNLLRELRDGGMTILISSHILSELQTVCDTVVVVEQGHAAYTGSLDADVAGAAAGPQAVELKVCADVEHAMLVLHAIPGVTAVRRKGSCVHVEYGVPLTCADMIATCVRNGVRLDEVRRESATLEAIFMRITGEHT